LKVTFSSDWLHLSILNVWRNENIEQCLLLPKVSLSQGEDDGGTLHKLERLETWEFNTDQHKNAMT